VAPRRQARDIFIDGQVFSWDSIDEIHITETDQTSDQLMPQIRAHRQISGVSVFLPDRWYVARDGRDVTEQFITGPPGTGPSPDPSKATTFAGNRRAVMVIYGHDKEANDALFAWLRVVGLQPREWSQLTRASGSASPFIGEVLDKALRDVQAVVAFFTPDEYVTAAGARNGWGRLQARPNVLIEAGMALITHPTRTIIAVLGDQELPSDLAGRHYVRLSHTDVEPLNDLAGRLSDAGCDVDLSGSDWLSPVRFPDRDITAPPHSASTEARWREKEQADEPALLTEHDIDERVNAIRAELLARMARGENLSGSPEAHGLKNIPKATSATGADSALPVHAFEQRGQGSRVVEIIIPQGDYKLAWAAGGEGNYFKITQERPVQKVLLSEVLKRPGPTTGELIARIDNNGRQIFSVDASKLEWQLKFTVL
jgi:predicted nucleotide-binding protein